jgi:hypothetical protein
MPRFELQFPPGRIDELAGRFSYADDSACLQAGRSAQLRGYYDRAEFLVVCEWKTSRSAPKVALRAVGLGTRRDGRMIARTHPTASVQRWAPNG